LRCKSSRESSTPPWCNRAAWDATRRAPPCPTNPELITSNNVSIYLRTADTVFILGALTLPFPFSRAHGKVARLHPWHDLVEGGSANRTRRRARSSARARRGSEWHMPRLIAPPTPEGRFG